MESCLPLQAVQKYFLSASDLNMISWNELLKEFKVDYDTCQNTQNLLLKSTVQHPLVLQHPMKVSYQQHFLKKFISILEENCLEVSDSVYSCYVQLLQKQSSGNEAYYRHFLLPNATCVSLCERASFISDGTTGLCSWQGSFALSEWIIKNQSEFIGKTVLELGSGTGLAGLTLLKYCKPDTFHFSDCHAEVLRQLRYNVILNIQDKRELENVKVCEDSDDYKSIVYYSTKFCDFQVNILNLSWEYIHEYDMSRVELPDVIIASDIVYDDSLFIYLCNTLEYFMRGREIYLLLVCTIRNDVTFNKFIELIVSKRFNVVELPAVTSEYIPFTLETPIKFLKINYSSSDSLKN